MHCLFSACCPWRDNGVNSEPLSFVTTYWSLPHWTGLMMTMITVSTNWHKCFWRHHWPSSPAWRSVGDQSLWDVSKTSRSLQGVAVETNMFHFKSPISLNSLFVRSQTVVDTSPVRKLSETNWRWLSNMSETAAMSQRSLEDISAIVKTSFETFPQFSARVTLSWEELHDVAETTLQVSDRSLLPRLVVSETCSPVR